jgi:hypothetical protein
MFRQAFFLCDRGKHGMTRKPDERRATCPPTMGSRR